MNTIDLVREESPPAAKPASNPAGDLPRTMKTAGAKDSSAELARKNFPSIAVDSGKEMRAGLTDAELPERKAARLAAIARFGTGPLPINPATGKRWYGTGRSPAVAETLDGLTAAQLAARKAARLAAIAKFGSGPLPINPATGKRWRGTGRSPAAGTQSPVWPAHSDDVPVVLEGRWRSRRERAAELRERMATFSAIYNAGWLVRDAYFGSRQRSDQMMMRFVAVLLREMRNCRDPEALMFAVADTLTASRHGLPWESN